MENQASDLDQNPQFKEQVPEKQAKHLLIGILILVCFVAVGCVGYYIGKQQSNVTQEDKINVQSLLSPTVTPEPEVTSPAPKDIITDSTFNWNTYSDRTFAVKIKYPGDWNYQGIAPGLILFKPKDYQIPQGIEAQVQGVYFRMLNFSYDESLTRLRNAYDAEIHEENITANGLQGKHIWGTVGTGQAAGLSSGAFVLKNTDGNAFAFEYEVTKDHNFQEEARLMMQSIEK